MGKFAVLVRNNNDNDIEHSNLICSVAFGDSISLFVPTISGSVFMCVIIEFYDKCVSRNSRGVFMTKLVFLVQTINHLPDSVDKKKSANGDSNQPTTGTTTTTTTRNNNNTLQRAERRKQIPMPKLWLTLSCGKRGLCSAFTDVCVGDRMPKPLHVSRRR